MGYGGFDGLRLVSIAASGFGVALLGSSAVRYRFVFSIVLMMMMMSLLLFRSSPGSDSEDDSEDLGEPRVGLWVSAYEENLVTLLHDLFLEEAWKFISRLKIDE